MSCQGCDGLQPAANYETFCNYRVRLCIYCINKFEDILRERYRPLHLDWLKYISIKDKSYEEFLNWDKRRNEVANAVKDILNGLQEAARTEREERLKSIKEKDGD